MEKRSRTNCSDFTLNLLNWGCRKYQQCVF
jgi:hypothetical protein